MDTRWVVKTLLTVLAVALVMSTVVAYQSDPTMWVGLTMGQINDFIISSAFCFLNIYSLSNLVHFKLMTPSP
jgi:hypothetical protein